MITGAPGAGKSVQAEMLQDRGIATWLSTGKLLREVLTGEQKESQAKGNLIDDSVTIKVLVDRLSEIDDSEFVVLDGFPRRDAQVEWLFTDENPRELDGVIYIDLPEEVAIERLHLRKREDDTDEIIQNRYNIFHEENQPILDHLERKNVKIERVDGDGTVDEVYDRVHEAVHKLSGHR